VMAQSDEELFALRRSQYSFADTVKALRLFEQGERREHLCVCGRCSELTFPLAASCASRELKLKFGVHFFGLALAPEALNIVQLLTSISKHLLYLSCPSYFRNDRSSCFLPHRWRRRRTSILLRQDPCPQRPQQTPQQLHPLTIARHLHPSHQRLRLAQDPSHRFALSSQHLLPGMRAERI